MGQNFLTDRKVVQKILAAAELKGDELVVEVGPGKGMLTEQLVTSARRVIAIEKDYALFNFLWEQFSTTKNLELVHADALLTSPPPVPYFWIANIPYSITSPLLDHFIRDNPDRLPIRAVLLVQKEVAEKICAKPPRMNVLALHVQTFGKPKMVATVSRHVFSPKPKVDSAIIRIDFPPPKEGHLAFNVERYFSLIHSAFGHKRKMLRATLPVELLKKADIEPTRRPETLSIEEWRKVAAVHLSRYPTGRARA